MNLSLESGSVYFLSLSLYKHPEKDGLEKRQSVPQLVKHADMQEGHGELFPTMCVKYKSINHDEGDGSKRGLFSE